MAASPLAELVDPAGRQRVTRDVGHAVLHAAARTSSEPEFANACLVEAEVVTNLVSHRLDDVQPKALGIVPEVAHQCVAKNQDLVGQATAPEERHTTLPGADVHAVRVVLGAAVGNDDRNVLQRILELNRQLVER
jgi:hypothetical protein